MVNHANKYIENSIRRQEILRSIHRTWSDGLPKEPPRAIRYVIGYKHQDYPKTFSGLCNSHELAGELNGVCMAVPLGWTSKYSRLIDLWNEEAIFSEEKGRYFGPSEILDKLNKLKEKRKIISLEYATQDADELYRMHILDINAEENKTLVYYDDRLVAKIFIEKHNFHVKRKTTTNDILKTYFEDGHESGLGLLAWTGHPLWNLELDIRRHLGENTSSFELIKFD